MSSLPFADLIGGGQTPNYGKIAASSSARRKGLIDVGLKQIDAVYGGGSAPFYDQAKQPGDRFHSKAGEYYTISKSGKFVPYWIGGKSGAAGPRPFSADTQGQTIQKGILAFNAPIFGSLLGGLFGGGKTISPLNQAKKAYDRGRLFTKGETQTFEGFQQPFFDARAQAYTDYALPQVGEQYRQNRNALNYGLSNRGLGTSSVADQGRSQVERIAGQARQNVADTAIDQANALKRSIEQARQENIQQLYQSADPARALQSAISTASSLRVPSAFAPLGDLFGNLARQYYLNQTLNNYRLGTPAPGQSQTLDLSGGIGGNRITN